MHMYLWDICIFLSLKMGQNDRREESTTATLVPMADQGHLQSGHLGYFGSYGS